MRIAVVGCSHGHLDTIYKTIYRINAEAKIRGKRPVELLADNGVLSERFVAVHATNLAPHEARLLERGYMRPGDSIVVVSDLVVEKEILHAIHVHTLKSEN